MSTPFTVPPPSTDAGVVAALAVAAKLEHIAHAIREGSFRLRSFREDRDVRPIPSPGLTPLSFGDTGGRVIVLSGIEDVAPCRKLPGGDL